MADHEQPTHPPQRVLHAPWRDQYLQQLAESDKADAGAKPGAIDSACFLCEDFASPQRDEQTGVIVRLGAGDDAGMILLNRYPYAGGHLMAALGVGRHRLLEYTPAQRASLWRLVDLATEIIERTLKPHGVNIGVNQGRAAGAGVPQHLHVHLVPRWGGDTNFITAVGRIRVNPSSLEVIAERYRQTWEQIRHEQGFTT